MKVKDNASKEKKGSGKKIREKFVPLSSFYLIDLVRSGEKNIWSCRIDCMYFLIVLFKNNFFLEVSHSLKRNPLQTFFVARGVTS